MSKTIVRYLPYTVYQTLQKFLEYRQLTLVGDVISDESKFIEILQMAGHITLAAKDNPSKVRKYMRNVPKEVRELPTHTYIIIVEPHSKANIASADFEKMLKTIHDFTATKRNFNLEIMVITHIVIRSNIQTKIDPYIKDGTADPLSGFIYIQNYPYRVFTTVLPDHEMVPPHYILTKEETDKVLGEIHCQKRDLPKMPRDDPIAIWIGAMPGDVVEVKFDCEDTITDVKYHLVL